VSRTLALRLEAPSADLGRSIARLPSKWRFDVEVAASPFTSRISGLAFSAHVASPRILAAPANESRHDLHKNARRLGRCVELMGAHQWGRGLAVADHEWRGGDHFAFIAEDTRDTAPGDVLYGTVLAVREDGDYDVRVWCSGEGRPVDEVYSEICLNIPLPRAIFERASAEGWPSACRWLYALLGS
jgi:hypothetical protein